MRFIRVGAVTQNWLRYGDRHSIRCFDGQRQLFNAGKQAFQPKVDHRLNAKLLPVRLNRMLKNGPGKIYDDTICRSSFRCDCDGIKTRHSIIMSDHPRIKKAARWLLKKRK